MKIREGWKELSLNEVDALRAAMLEAVHQCGHLHGWANSRGITSIGKWEEKVKADGFSPPWLSRWIREEDKRTWSRESLAKLGEIMRHYGVQVNGELMPTDYFADLKKYGKANSVRSNSPAFVRMLIGKLNPSDQLEVIAWIASSIAGNNRRKKE